MSNFFFKPVNFVFAAVGFRDILLCLLSIAILVGPVWAQNVDGIGASSGGESAEGISVPGYLGPASRATLDRIVRFSDNMLAVGGLMGIAIGTASPESGVIGLFYGPDTADAIAAISEIERVRINDEITLLMVTENLNDQEQQFWERVRDAANGEGMGSSSGEPHLVTFDGRRYSFQAAGEFVAVKGLGEGFEIQLRFETWKTLKTATVNTAAAFRVGNERVTVTYGNPLIVRINGEKLILHNKAVAISGGGMIAEKNGAISLIWPDFSTARITRAHLEHLDVWLRLAPGRKRAVQGLLGDFDGKPDNDLRLVNGQLLTVPPRDDPGYRKALYETFRNAWKVSAEVSLFDYEEGQTPATFDRPEIPPIVMSVDTLDRDARIAAEKICGAANFNDNDLYRQCVFDVGVTGEAGFAASALSSARRVGSDGLRLAKGLLIKGSITEPGAVDRHELNISDVRKLFFVQEQIDPALKPLWIAVYTKDGRRLKQDCFYCGNLGLVQLEEPGTYVFQAATLENTKTGNYRVRYWLVPENDRFDVALDARVSPGQPDKGAGRIEVPGAADEYRFNVNVPSTVRISVAYYDSALAGVYWYVMDEKGKQIDSSCFGCGTSRSVRLEFAGSYTLHVGNVGMGRIKGTGAYALSFSVN